LLKEHGGVTLAIDIMYINEIPFMMSISCATHFGTAEMIKNKTKSTIIKSLQQIIDTYHGCGFRTKNILGDQQFECIRKHMELQGMCAHHRKGQTCTRNRERYKNSEGNSKGNHQYITF